MSLGLPPDPEIRESLSNVLERLKEVVPLSQPLQAKKQPGNASQGPLTADSDVRPVLVRDGEWRLWSVETGLIGLPYPRKAEAAAQTSLAGVYAENWCMDGVRP